MTNRSRRLAQLSIFCLLLVCITISFESKSQQLNALNGTLNASQWNFAKERLALKGDWIWYNFELVDPAAIDTKKGAVVEFPKLWNEDVPYSEGFQGEGYATYTLNVIVPGNIPELAIEIPQVYSSYSLWINRELIAQNGKVGKDAESSQPQWRPQTVAFTNSKDTLHLVLQIANFDHSKGGCKEPIFLGEKNLMLKKSNLDSASTWGEFGMLCLLTLLFLFIYFKRTRNNATLFFALLTLSWAIRAIFSNKYVFISRFPDFDWTIMVRIEYLMLFSTMIWGILFVGKLFYDEVSRILKYAFVVITLTFAATALVAPPIVFTRWLTAYLLVAGMILVYGCFIVFRGYVNEKIGSAWLTVSILWVIGIFTYDIFSYEGFFAYNSLIFSAGYVVVFSLMGTALLYYLGVFKSTMPPSRLTFEEMYKNSPKA